MSYAVINKKLVRGNRELKKIQREDRKSHKRIRGIAPKARIGKVVRLTSNQCIDCTFAKESMESKENNSTQPITDSLEQLLQILNSQGIYGLGGAAFPTAEKITAVNSSAVANKVLIVNGVACDPGLLHDYWLMENQMQKIVGGIKVLDQYMNFNQIIFASKAELNIGNRSSEITEKIRMEVVPDKYPMGAEKMLLARFMDIPVDSTAIPAKQGILVLNVQTLLTIYEAACGNTICGKYVTAANLDTGEAKVVKVSCGQKVKEILERAFGKTEIAGEDLVAGGGALLADKADSNTVIARETNFIAFGMTASYPDNAKCKKCGGCTKNCPMGIEVHKMIQADEKSDWSKVSKEQANRCIQCGACNYGCYAQKNIMEMMKQWKAK